MKMPRITRGLPRIGHLGLVPAITLFCALAASASGASDTPKPESAPPRPLEAPRYSQLRYDLDYPTIGYADKASHNAFARLQERLNRGETKLEWRAPRGYLDSMLKALRIDKSSQVLVFSKTSLEFPFISDQTPRSIYFDDEVYVAWIPGAPILELMAVDSVLGPVFYTLDNRQPGTTVTMERETLRCLTCHDSFSLQGGGVPHFLMVSTYAGIEGDRAQRNASIDTTDATPLKFRLGGWYVTGQPGGPSHLGNIVIKTQQDLENVDALRKGNLETLTGLFDTRHYMSDRSDIVALLVLQHQVTVHNLITRAQFKARTIVARERGDADDAGIVWEDFSPVTQKALTGVLDPLVYGMLNVEAAAFPSPVRGNSGFDAWFQKQGQHDTRGRSLRDLDLRTRLFKYPLSYLIYSPGFEGLPEYARRYVYARISDVVRGKDQSEAFSHLTAADRQAILEILTATKPDFARATAAAAGT